MIVINNQKAISIAKEKIRAIREPKFKQLDLAIQNALLDDSDTAELIARRDYLRDLTSQCENKTVDELLELIKTLGI